MKKTFAMLIVVAICLSISSHGFAEKNLDFSEGEEAVVEMAEDAVSYLKERLVLPESFKLTSISYVSKIDELIFKIVFSAKNSYGGEIDTAVYFEYDISEKTFSDLYQSGIRLAESNAKQKFLKDFEYYIKYGIDRTETDKTSIYTKDAYFLEESEFSEGMYKIWEDFEKDIDISLFE